MRLATFHDLTNFAALGLPESVSLEYKRSDFISRGGAHDELCKSVSAFANSAGGQIVIGIAAGKTHHTYLDGGVSGNSRRDWIFQIVNNGTQPPIETFDIVEIVEASGIYYVIDVAPSPSAPHQSSDKKYYKRRGSHSEPMEHYEIDDIRSRPKTNLNPLRLNIVARDQIGFLNLKNIHPFNSVKSIKCAITSNFAFQRGGVEDLCSRGLKEVVAQQEKYFILASLEIMLERNPDAEINIHVNYLFEERKVAESFSFAIADFKESIVWETPSVRVANTTMTKIADISDKLTRLNLLIAKMANISDGSGIRLSQRTLAALKNAEFLFNPREFDFEGYEIILGISTEEALALNGIFDVIDDAVNRKKRYLELPQELRSKFESRFKLLFD